MQGIRNELFSNDSYSAVSVDDIKQQFPAHTDLQLYWPSRSSLDVPSGGSQSNVSINMWIQKPRGSPPPLPSTNNATAVIQKNPAASTVSSATRLPSTSSSAPALHQPSVIAPPARPTVVPPTCSNSTLYNGWSTLNSYAQVGSDSPFHTVNCTQFLEFLKQIPQQQIGSNGGNTSTSASAAASAHLASVLHSQSAAAAQAMLMSSMPVHHSSNGQSYNMMHYAQALFNIQQQQQSQQQAQSHRSQPAPPPPPPPPSHTPSTGSSSLDSLLRANGIHADHHR